MNTFDLILLAGAGYLVVTNLPKRSRRASARRGRAAARAPRRAAVRSSRQSESVIERLLRSGGEVDVARLGAAERAELQRALRGK